MLICCLQLRFPVTHACITFPYQNGIPGKLFTDNVVLDSQAVPFFSSSLNPCPPCCFWISFCRLLQSAIFSTLNPWKELHCSFLLLLNLLQVGHLTRPAYDFFSPSNTPNQSERNVTVPNLCSDVLHELAQYINLDEVCSTLSWNRATTCGLTSNITELEYMNASITENSGLFGM